MTGKIVAVCVSSAKGERKKPMPMAELREKHGIVGDAHAGDWHRQVSLLAIESIRKMQAMGLSVTAGDFAENITTEGLDLPALPVGARLRLGGAVLEITQIGKECHTRCAIYQQAGDCVMPKEGVFARVVRGGIVKTGDDIDLLASTPVAKEGKVRGKYKSPHKPFVVSMRMSDDEMENIHALMELTNKSASQLMREAYLLYKEKYASKAA